MHTVKLITHLVENHQVLAYAMVFLGLIFEGEIVLISTGILAHLGALNFHFALLFILCGGVAKTFLGYYVGELIHDKWHHTKVVQYLKHRVGDVMPNFGHKPFWSIFISKFIMGVNYIVIIFAGFTKVDYKTYLKAELLSTALWAPILLSLGYFFSYTALSVSREIYRFSLIIIIFIIAFILLDKLFGFIYTIFEEYFDDKRN